MHIYIYFGNGTVTSNSDGSVTFIAFDDFDFGYSSGDAPDPEKGWVVYNQEGGDLLEVALNPSGRQGNGLRYYSAERTAPVQWLGMNWTKTFGVAVHFDFYWENRDEQFRIDIYDYEDTSPWAGTWANPLHAWHLKYYPPDWPPPLDYSPEIIIAEDSWYDFEFQCTNTTYTLVVDETSHLGGLRATGDGYNSLLIYGYWNFYDEFYLDDFYVRKYVEIEPAHSTWGTVEEFSTTPTGPGEIDPWTILIIVGGGGAVIAIALVLVIVIRKSESGGSSQIPYNW